MASEVVGLRNPEDGRGSWVTDLVGGALFMAKTEPNSLTPDQMVMCYSGWPNTDPMRCTRTSYDGSGNEWAAARSRHTRGVNAAMCDGSVRFFLDKIELPVWQAMATRDGGESVTPP
jgi:prepilin-type processing-associated H-X9-DG protein